MASSKISQFKQLTEIDPSEATFFGLGRAYMEEGYFEDAADAFYKAIEKKPDYTAAYLQLGEALQHLNQIEKAICVYEKGITVGEQTHNEIPKIKMEKRIKRLRRNQKST